jgi:hypothetical protein
LFPTQDPRNKDTGKPFLTDDDILEFKKDKELQNKVLYVMHFPWFFNEGVSEPNKKEILWDFQFTHLFYSEDLGQSPELVHLSPLVKKINPTIFYRIKANLNPITEFPRQSGWHTDFQNKVCTTAVFYLNTNNGYTVFRNGEKVESVANRLLFFDSRLEHAGASCTNHNYRAVINLNYNK